MKVVDVIYTKTEAFTIFDNGTITRRKGRFEPTKPSGAGLHPLPEKPKPSDYDMVAYNLLGKEVARKNYSTWRWELDCQKTKDQNESIYKQQMKELKQKICSVRKRYYAQHKKNTSFLQRLKNTLWIRERS